MTAEERRTHNCNSKKEKEKEKEKEINQTSISTTDQSQPSNICIKQSSINQIWSLKWFASFDSLLRFLNAQMLLAKECGRTDWLN